MVIHLLLERIEMQQHFKEKGGRYLGFCPRWWLGIACVWQLMRMETVVVISAGKLQHSGGHPQKIVQIPRALEEPKQILSTCLVYFPSFCLPRRQSIHSINVTAERYHESAGNLEKSVKKKQTPETQPYSFDCCFWSSIITMIIFFSCIFLFFFFFQAKEELKVWNPICFPMLCFQGNSTDFFWRQYLGSQWGYLCLPGGIPCTWNHLVKFRVEAVV